jgi:MORN repeat variant
MPRNYIKRIFTALAVLLAVLLALFLYVICKPDNFPTSGLASSSQEKRDAAAKILRETAKPTSKIKWVLRTAFIRTGESKTNIIELLRSYSVSIESRFGMGGLGSYSEYYQLDDYWELACEYQENDEVGPSLTDSIIKWKLVSGWRAYNVWPSTNFSGSWINYYANGQKFTEGNYTNGMRFGEHISYEPDGSKSSVWNYDHEKANGLWTQYFPSGRIEIQCQYSNNARVGDMVWYYENGSKKFTEHYDDGKRNGLRTDYFPSGKIESQCQYSNYIKIGLEIKYNEDGTTNSVKDYSHP